MEPSDPQQPPSDLLRPFDAGLMKAWRTDVVINNVRNAGSELGQAVKDDGERQAELF